MSPPLLTTPLCVLRPPARQVTPVTPVHALTPPAHSRRLAGRADPQLEQSPRPSSDARASDPLPVRRLGPAVARSVLDNRGISARPICASPTTNEHFMQVYNSLMTLGSPSASPLARSIDVTEAPTKTELMSHSRRLTLHSAVAKALPDMHGPPKLKSPSDTHSQLARTLVEIVKTASVTPQPCSLPQPMNYQTSSSADSGLNVRRHTYRQPISSRCLNSRDRRFSVRSKTITKSFRGKCICAVCRPSTDLTSSNAFSEPALMV
jgi:hypothetical protein